MKKLFLLSFIALFSFSTVSAQKRILKKMSESAQSFIEKPLLVVLTKEKKDKHKLFNEHLKKAMESEWNLNETIEFVTEDEFKKLKRDKKSNYAFLRFVNNTSNSGFNGNLLSNTAIYFGIVQDKKSFHQESFELDDDITLEKVVAAIQMAQMRIEALSNYTFEN